MQTNWEQYFADDGEVREFPDPGAVDIYSGRTVYRYAVVKREFEKQHFFLVHDTAYVKSCPDGNLVFWTPGKFKQAYQHIRCIKRVVDVRGNISDKVVSFVYPYVLDPLKRRYNTAGYLPPPGVCQPGVYNTWPLPEESE